MRYAFKVPLFESRLIVCVGDSEKTWYVRECKKVCSEEVDLSRVRGNCCGSYVWLGKASLSTLVHELSHFTDMCLDHVGVADEAGEVRAYILGWAAETVWNRIEGGS